MRKELSVHKAISRGQLMVSVPAFIAIFGIPGMAFYLATLEILPYWGTAVAFLIGFIASWLTWGILITKWRVWAFENVRNVHELKKKAINDKLIWPDDSFFNKTEIWLASDRRRWERIQSKFDKEDVYKEDYSIPKKTEIYYSKLNYIEMIIMLAVTGFGIFLIVNQEYTYGIFLTAGGLFLSFREYKQASNREIQIYIDDKGMSTVNCSFQSWSNISNEEVIYKLSGKNSKAYLSYNYNKHHYEEIQVNDYSVSPKKLEKLLRTYRLRYEKAN